MMEWIMLQLGNQSESFDVKYYNLILNNYNINKIVETYDKFTTIYKSFKHGDINAREAACLNVQWRISFKPIIKNDLFAGRIEHPDLGFSPQAPDNLVGYYIRKNEITKLMGNPQLSEANKKKLQEILCYWKKENTVYKAKQTFSTEMKKYVGSDNYLNEQGIAFTLWRMSGTQIDYDKLLSLGVQGLRDEISSRIKNSNNPKAILLFKSMLSALNIFIDVCLTYTEQCRKEISNCNDNKRKKDLIEMQDVLQSIITDKPSSFREAIQLAYLWTAISGSLNYGRMDEYLGDFYVNDLTSGKIDKEESIRLLLSLWQLIDDRGYRYDSRLTIGGLGRRNPTNANKLALIILETTRIAKRITPQVTLRFSKNQDIALYNKGLQCLEQGTTYPLLYNDDVNINAVSKAFNISISEAENYIPYGCGEYTLYHRSVGTPSGVINLLHALNTTVKFAAKSGCKTFDEFLTNYKKLIELHLDLLAKHEKLEYDVCASTAPFLYISILYDNCLVKGKSIFDGGVKYLGGTMESYGNTNSANSLLAIKKAIYDEKKFTLQELASMLKNNFSGYDKERKYLLSLPKYGNDIDEADNMYVELHNHLCNYTKSLAQKVGLHSYLVVIINNDTHIYMGKNSSASPDGRLEGEYLANGNAAMDGTDTNGLTAYLNSIVKPDTAIHAGAVQNIKLSKELFAKHRFALESVLKTYFDNGGAQAMLTVVSKGELEDAILNPEKYPNLIVRVGGFSAKFVDLPYETQKEILERTLY